MKIKQMVCLALCLGLCLACNSGTISTASAAVIIDDEKNFKVIQPYDYTTNYSKVDGILYETHGEGLNKETLISKMEKNNISDVTIQFELKEKFYETETYQGIKSNRDSYLNHYDYLQDLRDACNEFYRSQIKNMGQDFNFSHADYYSSFYDISEHVFKNEHPYNALKKLLKLTKLRMLLLAKSTKMLQMDGLDHFTMKR